MRKPFLLLAGVVATLAVGWSGAVRGETVDLGEPFGEVVLVDEVDLASAEAGGSGGPGHRFEEQPAGVSKVETILGRPARVLAKTPGEAAYLAVRIGEGKGLRAGAAYILEVEYPEDVPRSMIILNAGNETSLGFATGAALGDALHPKYVHNVNESLQLPLSGDYQTWRMVFNLHDRFHDKGYVRGPGERPLTPPDGFTVTIAQWSAENLPVSAGAAVSRIRLYEVVDPGTLKAEYRLPPEGLPRRHIFWREEMADNVVESPEETKRGLKDPIDWYRYKANLMEFLGINTYTKDLLEFGANQGWDSTPHGGNDWVYFNETNKGNWAQIVRVMGERGFDVLPYYEYSGSKGKSGLGPQKRAKPLTRDDSYTHTKWIENANADITDPDTYEDFKKMLDLTVIQHKGAANFVGAWIRPRMQLPIGFGEGSLQRFAKEANGGRKVTREQLKQDTQLLGRYKQWWFAKRRDFLAAMRDYLREKGVDDAVVLFTAHPQEPGVPMPEADLVTDDVAAWKRQLGAWENPKDAKVKVLGLREVVQRNLYLKALLAEPTNWGGWERDHASPPPDPARYDNVEGVAMTYAFNRLYTVASPKALEAFRAESGLAMVRYFSLNENMMHDREDKPILGYFCADMERAGPYCMMAEAVAVANGDPRYLGMLTGRSHARGFPRYVRNFNTAFLSLPALPSERVGSATTDPDIVVRAIPTESHGTWYAVVNVSTNDKEAATITLPVAPGSGTVTDAATGEPIERVGDGVKLSLYPYQLRALHVGSD